MSCGLGAVIESTSRTAPVGLVDDAEKPDTGSATLSVALPKAPQANSGS